MYTIWPRGVFLANLRGGNVAFSALAVLKWPDKALFFVFGHFAIDTVAKNMV